MILGLGASDCELLRDAWLAQPANAVSSLAYVAAGLYVGRTGSRVAMSLAAALVAVAAGSVLYHGPMPSGAGLAHDGSIAALAVVVAVALSRRSLLRPPPVALVAAALAVAVNVLTRTGAPFCRPESVLQGHAAWHVLTAVALATWLGRTRPAAALAMPARHELL